MSNALTVYSFEYGKDGDRAFPMLTTPIGKGFSYSGIQLFVSAQAAQEAMQADAEPGDDADDVAVTVLKLNRNGDLYDAYGVNLHDLISQQNDQSRRDVRQHLQEYFLHELASRRQQARRDTEMAVGF